MDATSDSAEPEPDGFTPPITLPENDALDLLTLGELTVEGRLMDASNATLYCAVSADGVTGACIYKPTAGERPLWDFPNGTLGGREVAAYVVSAATGWDIVPPTVFRDDGPFGPGMAQLWIETDEDADMRAVLSTWTDRLQQLVLFDAVINNADRKGGHLLPTSAGHLYGVDHGVSFHIEGKLRTILWQFAGQEIPEEHAEVLRRLRAELDGDLGVNLRAHLTSGEVRKTRVRLDRLLALGAFPEPSNDWPSTPWPPW